MSFGTITFFQLFTSVFQASAKFDTWTHASSSIFRCLCKTVDAILLIYFLMWLLLYNME